MQRLTGLDAGFLYMETPTLHMHTLKVGIVDPSTVPGGYSFDRFKEVLGARLHLLPPFRQRLVKVPLHLHHPVWVEDPAFDLDYHLRRVGIPQPGTQREMDELIGDIASRPLDRAHPLWQLWALEGLDGGRVAFVAKIHHAAADGVAAQALLANVMSLTPELGEPEPPVAPWSPDRMPTGLELVLAALRDHLGPLRRLPELLVRTVRNVRAAMMHRRTTEVRPPRPIIDTPRTPFNRSLTPHREFATVSLPIADFKRVKAAFGVTLNDVVLATVGGTLRAYLEARGELPDRPLVAGVPVSSDAPDAVARLGGNKVSNLFTSLATDVADPVARLRRIHEVTREAKVLQNTLGVEMMQDWVEYAPPGPFSWFMRTYSRGGFASRHRPPINLVVSNVPGPREDLYIAGAKLTDLYSVGPVLEGIGLNLTVWSYTDRMNFGAIACREHLRDLHTVTDGLRDALDELLAAAAGRPAEGTQAG